MKASTRRSIHRSIHSAYNGPIDCDERDMHWRAQPRRLSPATPGSRVLQDVANHRLSTSSIHQLSEGARRMIHSLGQRSTTSARIALDDVSSFQSATAFMANDLSTPNPHPRRHSIRRSRAFSAVSHSVTVSTIHYTANVPRIHPPCQPRRMTFDETEHERQVREEIRRARPRVHAQDWAAVASARLY